MFSLFVTLTVIVATTHAEEVDPPPNSAAAVAWDATTGRLNLKYHAAEILNATVTATDTDGRHVAVRVDSKTDTADGKIE